MKDWLQKVEEAKKELAEKTLDQIQKETAIKWAARYSAAMADFQNTPELYTNYIFRDRLLKEANDYRSEALEHAAQVEDEMFYATIRMLIG